MSDQTDVPSPRQPADTARPDPVAALIELVVKRLTLGQEVAAAKYTSCKPIDDPAREHEVLQAAARALNGTARHQKLAIRFLRDQLEASKVIQRGLHQRWYAHPEEVPPVRGALAGEVRPKLDRITAQMITQFTYLDDVPHMRRDQFEDVMERQFFTGLSLQQLPKLHRHAALFALRSLCDELRISFTIFRQQGENFMCHAIVQSVLLRAVTAEPGPSCPEPVHTGADAAAADRYDRCALSATTGGLDDRAKRQRRMARRHPERFGNYHRR